MSKEQPQPAEPFSFTESEKLWDKISDNRFQILLADEKTTIHKIELSSNSYGEFVFVTVSRPEEGRQQLWTMYGLGYHDYRERWFTEEWNFYRANPFPETFEQHVSREEADELLRTRREEITPYANQDRQTSRGRLFEMIADMSDDDGTIAEMEDLGDLWNYLGGVPE